jgi:hypothetical protein
MGPLDHPRALSDGMGCTVCEERVPADRIRLLARRDDLLFLQVDCTACGSSSLGFVADAGADAGAGPEAARLAGGPPISSDDVLDMHAFLRSWAGDLETIVNGRAARSERDALQGPRRAVRRVGRTA